MKRIACLGLVARLVSGCTVMNRKNKLAVAAVTGGAAGAYIGWNIFGAGSSALLGALTIGSLGAGAQFRRPQAASLPRVPYPVSRRRFA